MSEKGLAQDEVKQKMPTTQEKSKEPSIGDMLKRADAFDAGHETHWGVGDGQTSTPAPQVNQPVAPPTGISGGITSVPSDPFIPLGGTPPVILVQEGPPAPLIPGSELSPEDADRLQAKYRQEMKDAQDRADRVNYILQNYIHFEDEQGHIAYWSPKASQWIDAETKEAASYQVPWEATGRIAFSDTPIFRNKKTGKEYAWYGGGEITYHWVLLENLLKHDFLGGPYLGS